MARHRPYRIAAAVGGDGYFPPMVFDDNPRPFHGYVPYADDYSVD